MATELRWPKSLNGSGMNWAISNLRLTRPYYDLYEKDQENSGGLFSITINPTTCKGCNECVAVCNDDALRTVTQTEESIAKLRDEWDFWTDLPNTPAKYNRIDDLEEKIGPLETILLNKDAYLNFASGDGACLGCSEKTVVHLFTATVESLMQPRIAKHVAYLEELIEKLEKHIQLKLMGTVNVSDVDAMSKIVADTQGTDLTMSGHREKAGVCTRQRADRPGVVEKCDPVVGQTQETEVEIYRWNHRQRPLHHGDDQLHRLYLCMGKYLSLQPLSVPVGQPPVPGFSLHGHGYF